jgi:tRNA(fMet)-specific endonuclease VapC
VILDTNALSAWAEGNPQCRTAFVEATRLVVPTIVLGEYLYGIRQSRHRARYERWLEDNLPFTEIQQITEATSDSYADLRINLRSAGTPIPANDLWIAAVAIELRLPILSNDSHFDEVPGVVRLGF